MIRNKFTLLMFSVTALFFSCGDDLEIPTLEPAFVVEPEFPEVGLPVMFDNLTINASEYEWDFGDETTSTEVSPTHTYSEAGSYEVTLIARSVDGQEVMTSQNIQVRQRLLVNTLISFFSTSRPEDGSAWDSGEVDRDTLPDVVVQFGSFANLESNSGIFTFPQQAITNFEGNDLLVPGGDDFNPIILTNEDWFMAVIDQDSEAESDELIGVARFNPVTDPSSSLGESGYFTILGFETIGQETFIVFEARVNFVLQ